METIRTSPQTSFGGLRRPLTMLLTMLAICVGTLVCSGGLMVVLDFQCVQNTNAWLPVYPNSTVLSESYTFLRPFGMGITRVRLSSPDAPNTVRQWYIDFRSQNEVNPVNLLASMNYSVQQGENGGSVINLSSECAWS